MVKRLMLITLALLVTLAACASVQIARNSGQMPLPPRPEGALRVASYNVHYIITFQETGPWSVGDWERRRGPLDAAFKTLRADLVAFQEMESFGGRSVSTTNLTFDWLLSNNPDYAAAAVGDPATFPSTQPILYRQDRLTLLGQGWFFFSDTPDVIYSRTFNGSFPAFASWAEFEDRQTGATFRVLNLHTDYQSRSNRRQSLDLVATRIAPWINAGETILVMGDFNALHGSALLDSIRDTGVQFPRVPGATYHFNRGLNLFGAIDHIGLSGTARPLGTPVVLRQQFLGEWPTDHYPVLLDITLTP